MQEGLTFIDIIILAALGVFIYTRFMGANLPKSKKGSKSANKKQASVLEFPTSNKTKTSKKSKKINIDNLEGLAKVEAAYSSFNKKEFLKGANSAYEYYYELLTSVDEDSLEDLVAPRMFDSLMETIDVMEDKGLSLKVDITNIESTEIVDAKLHGKTAILDVKYVANQAEYKEDNQANIKEGDKKPKQVTTIWTWAKSIDENDPNWELEDIKHLS